MCPADTNLALWVRSIFIPELSFNTFGTLSPSPKISNDTIIIFIYFETVSCQNVFPLFLSRLYDFCTNLSNSMTYPCDFFLNSLLDAAIIMSHLFIMKSQYTKADSLLMPWKVEYYETSIGFKYLMDFNVTQD